MAKDQQPDYYADLAKQPARLLQEWELDVLHVLALDAGLNIDLASLTRGECVRTMMDGGMGSFQITPPSGDVRVKCYTVAERWYRDADGVAVSLSLNLNEAHLPVEVDIWKVDSSPMMRPPNAPDLQRWPPGEDTGRP